MDTHRSLSCIYYAPRILLHLESGLTQSKNTVNILFKNVYIISAGLILYMLWGFNAMYPGDLVDGLLWEVLGLEHLPIMLIFPMEDRFMPHRMGGFSVPSNVCATAATIVSGAVAERIKLGSFMIYAALLVGVLSNLWWLALGRWMARSDGFYDFAGSSVVHAFGGFAALACCVILGPRAGKYSKDGGIKPILASSMPLACIGVFYSGLGGLDLMVVQFSMLIQSCIFCLRYNSSCSRRWCTCFNYNIRPLLEKARSYLWP